MKLIPYRDVLLVKKSKSFWAKVVKMFLKQDYTHAEYVVSDWLTVGTDFSRPVSIAPFGYNISDIDIWRFKNQISPEQKDIIIEEIQKASKIKYDWWEAVCVGFGLPTKDNKKYICISLIVNAMFKAGLFRDWHCFDYEKCVECRKHIDSCHIEHYKGFDIFTKSGFFEKME